MAKKAKTVDITVPAKYADDIRMLVAREINKLEKPRKPIKRVLKVTDKQLVKVKKLVKELLPHVKALDKENSRLLDLYDLDLLKVDQDWVDKQQNRIADVLSDVEDLMPEYA